MPHRFFDDAGVFTWPEIANSFVPALFGTPEVENHQDRDRGIVGTTAMDSTLFTVVGQPYRTGTAGNGGFIPRACPFCPLGFRAARFLAADIRTGHRGDIGCSKVIADLQAILADQTGVIRFVDGGLQASRSRMYFRRECRL